MNFIGKETNMKPEDCIYHTLDNGCEKLFIMCPYITDDEIDLGCGGCNFEQYILESVKENANENNKK